MNEHLTVDPDAQSVAGWLFFGIGMVVVAAVALLLIFLS